MIKLDRNHIFRNSKSDVVYAVENAFQFLGIKYSRNFLMDTIDSHHNYPSLQTISDVLDAYGLRNTAYQFDQKEELLKHPQAHISYIINEGTNIKMFVFVEKIENDTVYYAIPAKDNPRKEEPSAKFFEKWTGIALFFNETKEAAEPNYIQNRRVDFVLKYKLPFVISFFAGLMALVHFLINNYNAPLLLFANEVLKISGFVLSVIMVSYSYNKNNPFLKGICALNEKTDCNAILASNAAKAFGLINWSEIGMVYFLSTFILTWIAALFDTPGIYYSLWMITILSLPYTFYSIYYQFFVVKKICLLCTSVQVILWLEFIAGASLGVFKYDISINNILICLFAGVGIFSAWLLIRPFVESYYKLPNAKKELKKFKLNPDLFKTVLMASKPLRVPAELSVLFFGNKKAPIQFTIFTNPMCGPCGVIHGKIDKLLRKYPAEIGVTFVFTISSYQDNRRKVAAAMLHIYQHNNPETSMELYNKWFSKEIKSPDEWLNEVGLSGDLEKDNLALLEKYVKVNEELEILVTPTIAINGFQIPDYYSFEDVTDIIPYLV